MKIFFAIIFLFLTGCDNEAKHRQCIFVYGDFSDAAKKMIALDDDRLEKLYYSNLASMNLQIILDENCCKWDDTCPAGINDR